MTIAPGGEERWSDYTKSISRFVAILFSIMLGIFVWFLFIAPALRGG